jgi:hypothetical protein
VKKNLCAVNYQLLFPENDFNSIQKIAAKQVFFRGSGSVQLRAFYHLSRPGNTFVIHDSRIVVLTPMSGRKSGMGDKMLLNRAAGSEKIS